MSLANKFVAAEELDREEPSFPLKVGFCKGCGHVQLTEIVPPPVMFNHYLYVSSMSDTLKAHFHNLARCIVERWRLKAEDLVIDVGANDGTLLGGFRKHGIRTLGVDPARNLAELARSTGVETVTAFFGAETAASIAKQWGRASVVTATNTFPHLPDLADFMAGLDAVMADDGVFVLETHYLQDLLDQGAFDTIYHEHCSYWALGPMVRLFERFGMEVVDVERLPVHHGQVRAWVCRKGQEPVRSTVQSLIAEEEERRLHRFETFQDFARRVRHLKKDLNANVNRLLGEGKRIAAYGAPAKGNTLLTFLGIGPDRIAYIADRSPLKQGRYTPGTHIPVVAPERILEDQPDYLLLLAWNFADEILDQQAEYRRRGGRFILPVPEVRIV